MPLKHIRNICSENRKLNTEEFKRQSVILKSRPVRAWISFSERCNLSCVHCPRTSYGDAISNHNEMSSKIFDKLEEEFFLYLDECKIGGNSLGEQLLAKQWDYFSERIGMYPFSRRLVTNGLLLNKKKITKLVGNGWTIDFSTEGATKETYNSIRGGNFDRFIDRIHESCKQKKSLKESKANIRLCLTAFYDNIRELTELIKLSAKFGVDEILVTHLIPMRECQRNQSLVYHKGLANSVFEEGIRLAQELGISLRLPPPFPIQRMDAANESEEEASSLYSKKLCSHPWTSISVTEKGDVMPCCIFDTPMGNLHEASFEEIWNSRKYKKLRKTVNSSAPIGRCRNCPLRGDGFTSVNCNDDRALLSVIGLTNQIDFGYFLRLKVKKILGHSPWKKATLKKLKAAYKKFTF